LSKSEVTNFSLFVINILAELWYGFDLNRITTPMNFKLILAFTDILNLIGLAPSEKAREKKMVFREERILNQLTLCPSHP
jgi:hypothetical protein